MRQLMRLTALYWRKHAPDGRAARTLRDIAWDHPDWDDTQIIAWYNYTGGH